MAGYEVLDGEIVVGQPELSEEICEVVHGFVHAFILLLIGVAVKSDKVYKVHLKATLCN